MTIRHVVTTYIKSSKRDGNFIYVSNQLTMLSQKHKNNTSIKVWDILLYKGRKNHPLMLRQNNRYRLRISSRASRIPIIKTPPNEIRVTLQYLNTTASALARMLIIVNSRSIM